MIAPPRLLPLLPILLMSGIASAAPTMTLDLASPPPGAKITRILGHGSDNDGVLGVPVCGGFDCDGDGHNDFAFAQFRADPLGRPGAGEVSVVFGKGSIGVTADSAIAQSGILLIAGFQPYETAGDEAWMDDVTGDGLGDLLIGRQNHSLEFPPPGLPRVGCGALTILVGDPGWKTQAATLTHLDLGAPPAGLKLITFVGPAEYDRLGIWFRTGDITGDGIADILVGADEVDAVGQSVSQNQGAAFVIRGGPHLLDAPDVVDLAEFGQPTFPASLKGHVAWIDPPPGSSDYHFGATVQVGDLDGNGRAEIMVAATLNRAGAGVDLPGAPSGTGEASGGSRDGTLYIVWDENFPPGLWPENHRFEATSPPFGDFTSIDGDSAARSFGEEILGGLDYSGDGFADLFVGDLVADPLGRSNAGRGYIFYSAGNLRGLTINLDLNSPPPGVALTIIDGPIAGAISSDTALHGDFDGDGIGDLGIGNPHDDPLGRSDAGSLHVLYGQAGGWPLTVDLKDSNLPDPAIMRIALVQGANGTSFSDRGDTLCYSAAHGDINGDGRPDLIVNEMAGNGFGGSPEDVGNMLVIDAASLLAPFQPSLDPSISGPVDFGSVQISAGTAMRSITFTNNSAGLVNITSLGLSGPAAAEFMITSDSGESTLGIGDSRVVTVTYDPSVVGRAGAALTLQTDVDPHSFGVGLAGRGVNSPFVAPIRDFSLVGKHVVAKVQSQFGTDYSLTLDQDLTNPTPPILFTVPGNGQSLYLVDPDAFDTFNRAFYRVRAERN
ncbi:MAG: choice-of-anchor D domain-containing protein [Roseibacillus sp.]|jgi:hypothetical protein